MTAALDQGHDLRSVQRFARHANLATTMIYDDNRRHFGGE
ncbi:MAG: integrase, partial [Planctomycetes bacterium]|nr:integrase [Planctomycetota bacterium]